MTDTGENVKSNKREETAVAVGSASNGLLCDSSKNNMKPFWENLFYDMRECGLSEELFAVKAGEEIRDDLRRIEDAIRDHNGRKALTIIDELKCQY